VTKPGLRRVCVFCGSSAGAIPAFAAAAEALGRTLGAAGITVVYGGASVGLMGRVADACLAAGGEVIGVIPRALVDLEVAHGGLSELRVVGSMHERKALMADLADAFVALPGGLGTLDELFEILSWAQLGLHEKPVGVLNVENYFAPLLGFLDGAVAARFVKPVHRQMVIVAQTPRDLLEGFVRHVPPPRVTWTDRPAR
jgi:uncharacterized protein (TIGR00730 family)